MGSFEHLRRRLLAGVPADGWQQVETTALPVKHPSRVRGPAARLASAAGPGEALVSDATCAAAGLQTGGLERRRLQLKGRSEPVSVRVLRVAPVGLDGGETATR